MEPTSEQELKQLLDEGKISEQEYQELQEALRQKEITPQQLLEKPAEPKGRSIYGKTALVLFIMSITLPILSVLAAFLFAALGVKIFFALTLIPIALICALLAFIFGIIGWKTPQGKVAAIGVPCLGFLIVPFLLLAPLVAYRASYVPAESEYLVCHKAYPLDSMTGVLTQDGVELDTSVSSDGNGSLKIGYSIPGKKTIRLFETGPMSIDNCMLIYSARVKSQLGAGNAYLEMWCDIPGRGEFFARGLEQPITGITEWTNLQTPFRLEEGQMPANVKLNLVIEGIGMVWIDDIKLLSSPLSELRSNNSWR